MSGGGSTALRGMGRALADLIWPRSCLVCASGDPDEFGVCAGCWRMLLPAPSVEIPAKAIDRLAVAFAYDDTLRAIVHRFKFEHQPGLAIPLAEQFETRLGTMGFTIYDSIFVPVPSHPARQRERGYNPAERLATALANRFDMPSQPKLARRLVHGPHQSQLPDDQRKRTLQRAFTVDPPPAEASSMLRLVLVDDVIHTGRTLSQLARAARKAGWKRIDAVILSA